MAASILTTSPSIVMHASLAYLSPELQTFDSIIRDAPTMQPTLARSKQGHIPMELLLLIRAHLVPTIIADLFNRSTSALARYESSLQDLLCLDCISYNREVYGPDIWQWEQFSGACECMELQSNTDCFEHPAIQGRRGVNPNPKEFTDSSHWLECHLSGESLHLRGRPTPRNASTAAIWDLVEDVLRDHDCQIFHDMTGNGLASCVYIDEGLRELVSSGQSVIIAPLPSAPAKYEWDRKNVTVDDPWKAHHILQRTSWELGLCFEYEEDLEKCKESVRSRPRLAHGDREMVYKRPTVYTPPVNSPHTNLVFDALRAIATVVAICLSLPLTLATLALTVLCYFSKPTSLRIM